MFLFFKKDEGGRFYKGLRVTLDGGTQKSESVDKECKGSSIERIDYIKQRGCSKMRPPHLLLFFPVDEGGFMMTFAPV